MSSKYSYMIAGFCVAAALLFAMGGSIVWALVEGALGVLNYYIAESRRSAEEAEWFANIQKPTKDPTDE
jgi:hypothetical protein